MGKCGVFNLNRMIRLELEPHTTLHYILLRLGRFIPPTISEYQNIDFPNITKYPYKNPPITQRSIFIFSLVTSHSVANLNSLDILKLSYISYSR